MDENTIPIAGKELSDEFKGICWRYSEFCAISGFSPFRIAYLPLYYDYCGLGNRLKVIAGFYTLGYRKIVVAWNAEGWVSMPFTRLFRLEDCHMISLSQGTAGFNLLRLLLRRFMPMGIIKPGQPFWSFIVPYDLRRDKYSRTWGYAPHCPAWSIDCLYQNIDEDIRERYRPFFEALKPARDVVQRIENISLPEDVVTVQIRNTGISDDKKEVAQIESFFPVLDSYPKTQTFFISAMNKQTAQIFHDRYGARCVELPNKNYMSMIDAVADMWLLGRGKEMVVSPGSTFAEVAWWWGGREYP